MHKPARGHRGPRGPALAGPVHLPARHSSARHGRRRRSPEGLLRSDAGAQYPRHLLADRRQAPSMSANSAPHLSTRYRRFKSISLRRRVSLRTRTKASAGRCHSRPFMLGSRPFALEIGIGDSLAILVDEVERAADRAGERGAGGTAWAFAEHDAEGNPRRRRRVCRRRSRRSG